MLWCILYYNCNKEPPKISFTEAIRAQEPNDSNIP